MAVLFPVLCHPLLGARSPNPIAQDAQIASEPTVAITLRILNQVIFLAIFLSLPLRKKKNREAFFNKTQS